MGSPSRQDTLTLTYLCSGAQRERREGWGGLMAGSVWKCLHSHHADTADCQLALLPTCRWQPLYQMPSRGLTMWSLHVGLLGFFTGRQVSAIVRGKREAGRRSCEIFYELAVKSMSHSKHIVCISSSNAKNTAGCCLGMSPLQV